MTAPDFIEIYPDALSADQCKAMIEHFERGGRAKRGATGSGVDLALKDSWDIMINAHADWKPHQDLLLRAAFAGLRQYVMKHRYALIAPLAVKVQLPGSSEVRSVDAESLPDVPEPTYDAMLRYAFRSGTINVQKYLAGQGGYPYWHCEHYPRDASCESLHRVLLWTVYLNDGFEAGETEFVYQDRKIAPRTGSLLIAPAFFTHTHRGNRPIGRDKYIATSWILFNRAETLFGANPQGRAAG